MKTGFAKIELKKSFCTQCSVKIRRKLQMIDDISNVRLYPTDSLVIFNFIKANELSDALNLLTDLGYPPKGDKIDCLSLVKACSCHPNHESIQ